MRSLLTSLTALTATAHLAFAGAGATFVPAGLNLNPGDCYGHSLSVSGTTAAISAPGTDDFGYQSGAVYILDIATGGLLRTIAPLQGNTYSDFGHSVALDGELVAISARSRDHPLDGRVYVMNVRTGGLVSVLDSALSGDPVPADWFGYAVAIRNNTVLVSAPYSDMGGDEAGAVYAFDATSGALRYTLTGTGAGARFGTSLAMDGTTAAIGAPNLGTGANDGTVYFYDIDSGTMKLAHSNTDPQAPNRSYGWSVALDGSTAIIGRYSNLVTYGVADVVNVLTGETIRTIRLDGDLESSRAHDVDVAISGTLVAISYYPFLFEAPDSTPSPQIQIFDIRTGAHLETIRTLEGLTTGACTFAGNTLVVSTPGVAAGGGTVSLFEFNPKSRCTGDTNGDNQIDFHDLNNVIGNWEATCP